MASNLIEKFQAQPWYLKLEHAALAACGVYFANALIFSGAGFKGNVMKAVMSTVKMIPGGKALIESEQKKILSAIEGHVKGIPDDDKHTNLPLEGLSADEVRAKLAEWREKEKDYRSGKAFGGIYNDDPEHKELLKDAMMMYMDSNALYPQIFPGLRKFEAEIVSMTARMLCGDEKVVGCMTSGGTESICMAMKAYRDRGRDLFGIQDPEIVVPQSAHAAFLKSGHYFGIKIVLIDIPEDECTPRVEKIKAAINSNTVAVVASAPNYPNGHIDPVEEISQLLVSFPNIGLHVDACLGGFLLPWLKKSGTLKKNFDFSLPCVTTMSIDIHKYGYGPKGTSVVLYRDSSLRRYQYFTCVNWSGGLYCSPSFQGSRAGGPIAAAWACLMHMGENGYTRCAKNVDATFRKLVEGVNSIPHLYVFGNPDACCVTMRSDDIDIYKVADAMSDLGWQSMARLHKPCSLMLQVGKRNDFDSDAFLLDLAKAVEDVACHPERFKEGLAPIYGMAASMPDRGTVSDLMEGYMDVLLQV